MTDVFTPWRKWRIADLGEVHRHRARANIQRVRAFRLAAEAKRVGRRLEHERRKNNFGSLLKEAYRRGSD